MIRPCIIRTALWTTLIPVVGVTSTSPGPGVHGIFETQRYDLRSLARPGISWRSQSPAAAYDSPDHYFLTIFRIQAAHFTSHSDDIIIVCVLPPSTPPLSGRLGLRNMSLWRCARITLLSGIVLDVGIRSCVLCTKVVVFSHLQLSHCIIGIASEILNRCMVHYHYPLAIRRVSHTHVECEH